MHIKNTHHQVTQVNLHKDNDQPKIDILSPKKDRDNPVTRKEVEVVKKVIKIIIVDETDMKINKIINLEESSEDRHKTIQICIYMVKYIL